MKRVYFLVAVVLSFTTAWGQEADPISDGVGAVITVAGEMKTPEDSVKANGEGLEAKEEKPLWKQKLYYGYNFDIYFHHDSKTNTKENGWSIAIEPEIGWKLKERIYLGMRIGGSFQDSYTTYSFIQDDGTKYSEDLRVMHGSWSVTPYVRYRLKTLFHDKLGIWLEGHLYTGIDFPRVTDGVVTGTEYEGLKHSVTYGLQISPVITYKFNPKSTFQIFFSIMSFGYSGTTRCYDATSPDGIHNEFSHDVIIFSGKLRNLIANQFTPGLYGLKFGIQKSF